MLTLPASLSPSKMTSFKNCPLAFRYSVIDHLPEPPSPAATKGTVVHRALELLFTAEAPGDRTIEVARETLLQALGELDEEISFVAPTSEDRAKFVKEAGVLLDKYFTLEDPNTIRVVGNELLLEVKLGSMTLRGIIDRLETDDDGELVVSDYKSGRSPWQAVEQSRLGGVHFYAFMCEKVFGRIPSRVQLLYLADPVTISTTPSEQTIRGFQSKAIALWAAIEKACETENFQPKPSKLCDYCAHKPICPAWN